MGRTVSELVSSRIGSTITDSQTWNIMYNAKQYSSIGDGVIDDSAALSTLINTTINGSQATIIFPRGTYRIGTALTVPSNVTLYLPQGAKFTVDTGITLIINGVISAGLYQIFTGSGTIAGTPKVDGFYPQWWGAKGDGVTDDTAPFIAALAAGNEVVVPEPSVHYRVTNTITLSSNKRLIGIGSRPEIKLDSSAVALLFNLDNSDGTVIENLTLNGNNTVTPSDEFISMDGSTNCIIRECVVNNAPSGTYGSIVLSGSAQQNLIEDNDFDLAEGIAVSLTGANVQYNTVIQNKFTNSGSFGIRLGENANRNEITGNKTSSNGLELIGITSDCFLNRIAFNHAEGCGDNGISISGFNNTVVGNICRNNYGAGIWCWGSFNTVVGNECLNNNQQNTGNNWSGIGVSANYGGCGQFNTIIGNLCDDDQTSPTQWNGVRISGSVYILWASSQAITSGQYRYYGLNVYYAVNSGTTGATPPTHTSGDVSDGGVTWRYKRTFLTSVGARYNVVSNNTVPRYQSGDYFDSDSWANNILISQSTVDQRATGNYRVGIGAANALFVNVGGTDKARFASTEFRPEADLGMKLGLSNRQWSQIYGAAYFVGTNQVVAGRRTGWSAATGTATRTTFDTTTVTTAQLAERVKALLDDLIAHGLIGT